MKVNMHWGEIHYDDVYDYRQDKMVKKRSDFDDKWIYMDYEIVGLSEDNARKAEEELLKGLKEDYEDAEYVDCYDYDREKKILYGAFSFDRNDGSVTEDKKDIMRTARAIAKELKVKYDKLENKEKNSSYER